MDKFVSMHVVILISLVSLLYSAFLFLKVKKCEQGTEEMSVIANRISLGATAYLKRQYKSVGIFFACSFVFLFVLSFLNIVSKLTPYAFVLGGFLSGLTGLIGMKTSTMANVRTAAASRKGLSEGLKLAFSAGSIVGFVVVGIGLLGLSSWYFFLHNWFSNVIKVTIEKDLINQITFNLMTFGMGVSCMSLFARVGGGIFTKAADVGADLVGKVENTIPEDDPRNPATIADNVGDNVGDVAGMSADLFESFVTSIVSCSALSLAADFGFRGVILPFLLAAAGVFASIVASFFVKVSPQAKPSDLLSTLRRGNTVSSALVIVFSLLLISYIFPDNLKLFLVILVGILAGVLIGFMTEIFTSSDYKPTKELSRSAKSGAGTVVIKGLSLGMFSTVYPVLIVCVAILLSFFLCGSLADAISFGKGLYGVSISAIGMLSTLGIVLSTDAYGPIADNAGGIAEMANLPAEVRKTTDALDSLGNTTAATGKGFAIGSAALASLSLTGAYFCQAESLLGTGTLNLSIINPVVLVGLFLGAMIPFLFSAFTMDSVSRAAMSIVEEVRHQFSSIPGLLEGTSEPNYQNCIDICAKNSIRFMLTPAVISIFVPIAVSLFLGASGILGLLTGATVSGFVLALTMANAGGSWDNAKKYIESGHFGGKGSAEHKAAVVGDTVGDPFKDTSGPAINILIKLLAMVSIVFVGLAVSFKIF